MSQVTQDNRFVLGCAKGDGTIAILCRSTGAATGPAYCDSKKDAVKLKTRLVNDPRGSGNHRAMQIIKNLLVYKLNLGADPIWEEGLLWAYLPTNQLKCVESQSFW